MSERREKRNSTRLWWRLLHRILPSQDVKDLHPGFESSLVAISLPLDVVLTLVFQPIRMAGRDELERPVVPHGLGTTQPDLTEASPAEETDQPIAVEDQGVRKGDAHAMG